MNCYIDILYCKFIRLLYKLMFYDVIALLYAL